jgi:hypothetical protein
MAFDLSGILEELWNKHMISLAYFTSVPKQIRLKMFVNTCTTKNILVKSNKHVKVVS